MRIGDLVRVCPRDSDRRERNAGVILRFDLYYSGSTPTSLAEVLWTDGPGWIDVKRIEKLGEVK